MCHVTNIIFELFLADCPGGVNCIAAKRSPQIQLAGAGRLLHLPCILRCDFAKMTRSNILCAVLLLMAALELQSASGSWTDDLIRMQGSVSASSLIEDAQQFVQVKLNLSRGTQ